MPKPKAFLKESKSKKKTAQQVCRTVDMTLMTTYIYMQILMMMIGPRDSR